MPTIKTWAGILEASYLCCFLPPYFRNYGKRLIKTPKLYFIDSSIACALTRQPDGKSAISGAMGGAFFEGLIITEALKVFTMKGKKPDLYFWRSHDGLEVDLIVRIRDKLYLIEIKLTPTPTVKHLDPLNKFKKIAGKDVSETGIIVCRVSEVKQMPEKNLAVPWHVFPEWLKKKIE